MPKKYNLILGQDIINSSDAGYIYCCAYTKIKNSYIIQFDKKEHISTLPQYQFTQNDIDDLKSQLPTDAMRKIVDLAKVEAKEPLYYMQSKHIVDMTQGKHVF